MKKILTSSFFDQPVLTVAQSLLGKYLVRRYRRKTVVLMITEVEAYDGPHDLASHASHGRTPRTKVMFGKPGKFYVYFTYGMHWLVNIVTGPEGYPAAVLLRAGITTDGRTGKTIAITGPARLTKFLKIDGSLNDTPATRKTGLWLEDRGVHVRKTHITVGVRIGVDRAGPVWKDKPYNFTLRLTRK